MSFKVFLTEDAATDLSDIHEYLAQNESPEKADYVLGKIESVFIRLKNSPNRGVYPQELVSIGIRDYREVFFKPYRIIYRVIDKKVYVFLIADGRRDMESLLQRRLLG